MPLDVVSAPGVDRWVLVQAGVTVKDHGVSGLIVFWLMARCGKEKALLENVLLFCIVDS